MKKLLALLILALAATACADVTGDALQINDRSYGRDEINDLLDTVDSEIREDAQVMAIVGEPPLGTISTQVSAPVLTIFIQNEALSQQADSLGVEIAEADIVAAGAASAPTGSATVDRLLAEVNATAVALQGAGLDQGELFADLEVTLDARYGRWLPDGVVVAPNPGPSGEVTGS